MSSPLLPNLCHMISCAKLGEFVGGNALSHVELLLPSTSSSFPYMFVLALCLFHSVPCCTAENLRHSCTHVYPPCTHVYPPPLSGVCVYAVLVAPVRRLSPTGRCRGRRHTMKVGCGPSDLFYVVIRFHVHLWCGLLCTLYTTSDHVITVLEGWIFACLPYAMRMPSEFTQDCTFPIL